MTKKRTLGNAAAPSPHDGSSLERITRALDGATRKAATWASGYETRFPLPALAFKSDGENISKIEPELSLPVRPEDCKLIKARGVVSQRHEGAAVAWDVRGDLIESRNPSWHAFLDEQLARIRRWFGIFDHEEVKLSLRKMVLAETDGLLLCEPEDDTSIRPSGAFGTFVVVLPGLFEGGEVEIQQDDITSQEHVEDEQKDDDEDEDDSDPFWWPDSREHAYCVTYAAFYDHCKRVAYPVGSGSALCLVFDLVTTPRDLELLQGPEAVQCCVDRALLDHFQVMPEPMVKRLKISADAWKTVREFAMDRSFVYLLQGKEYEDPDKTFSDLKLDDRLVANSLASFCEQSKGEYALYLARVFCCRYVGSSSNFRDRDSSDEDEDSSVEEEKNDSEIFATLKAPWLKWSQLSPENFPPFYINHHRDVAPVGRVNRFPLARERYHNDRADYIIVEHLYGTRTSLTKCVTHTTYALVILPASVEDRESTKLPLPEAVARLRTKLSQSREDALHYARRVVGFRPEWTVRPRSEGFPALVSLLIDINDRQLFNAFLSSLELDSYDQEGHLRKAIEHFGWDSCEATVIKRLEIAPCFSSRVNLLTSVVDPYDGAAKVDRLLDVLLSSYPWTAVTVDDSHFRLLYCSSSDFRRLLEVVYQSSPQRLIDAVSVSHVLKLVNTVVPAVASFVEVHAAEEEAWLALTHVRNLVTTMRPEIQNYPYSRVRITAHCGTCDKIQAFLASTVIQADIECKDAGEVEHTKVVLASSLKSRAKVETKLRDERVIRLTKSPETYNDFSLDAADEEKRMIDLMARHGRSNSLELESQVPHDEKKCESSQGR